MQTVPLPSMQAIAKGRQTVPLESLHFNEHSAQVAPGNAGGGSTFLQGATPSSRGPQSMLPLAMAEEPLIAARLTSRQCGRRGSDRDPESSRSLV